MRIPPLRSAEPECSHVTRLRSHPAVSGVDPARRLRRNGLTRSSERWTMSHEHTPRTGTADTVADCPCPICGNQALKRIKVPSSADGFTWDCQHCHHASTLGELRRHCQPGR